MSVLVRLGAVIAPLPLAVAMVLVSSAPSSARPATVPESRAGSSWLVQQLDGGLVVDHATGLPNLQVTELVTTALGEIGGQPAALVAIGDAVAGHAKGWIEPSRDDSVVDGAAAARVLSIASTVGRDVHSYGGLDVQAALEGALTPGGALRTVAGHPAPDVIDQAIAVHSLSEVGSTSTSAALATLLAQQCTDGSFATTMGDTSACADPGRAGATAATGIVAVALRGVGGAGTDAALDKARAWLRGVQDADGRWGNSIATGLAVRALAPSDEADRAATALRRLQITTVPPCQDDEVAGEEGAVAYDTIVLKYAKRDTIKDSIPVEQAPYNRNRLGWIETTAYAAPALALAPPPPGPLDIAGPGGYRRASSWLPLRINNVAQGDFYCLSGTNFVGYGWSGPSEVTRSVILPFGTATRTYRVQDTMGRSASVSFKVLGAKDLYPRLVKTVVPMTRYQGLQITGMAPGERMKVTWKGRAIRTGKANARGVFKTSWPVGRRVGRFRVGIYGQFPGDRSGAVTFRVGR